MKLGTAYYPDYFPRSEWSRDLDRMKAAGIQRVRILEFAWSWYQPEPKTWVWDGLDHFLDLAQEKNLAICLSTGTATPPPWFFEKYPDARLMNDQGHVSWAHRHMTCWNHPQAWEEAARTIEVLARRYGNHPAVWGWQIDNEPNHAEDPSAFYDFNPHAIRDGQEWLKNYYGSLDALNTAWYNSFWSQRCNRWEQIWRSHHPKNNPASLLAFLEWREDNLGRFVGKQAALLRKETRGQSIGVNIPETGLPFSLQIAQNYWAQARGLDWVGTDLYAATGNRENDCRALRYSCDLIRSVRDSVAPDAEFLIAETQAGPHLRAWKCAFAGDFWEPDYLRDSLQIYAERGASQSWLFMWRPTAGGKETGMNGLQTMEGDDSPRTLEVRRLAFETDLFENANAAYQKRPVALLHYSQQSLRYLLSAEPQGDSSPTGSTSRSSRILRGTHLWLDQMGYQIRFVTDAEILKGLPKAHLLALPLSPLLGTKEQQAVIQWHLDQPEHPVWLGPDTGLLNENGHWLTKNERPLWSWINVTPGPIIDMGETLVIGEEVHSRFRVLENFGDTEILSSGSWRGQTVPGILKSPSGIRLCAYDWTSSFGTTEGCQSIPT